MIYCLSIERFTFTDDMVLKIINFKMFSYQITE